MIERDKVVTLLKSYFPGADCGTVERLADDIIRDVVPIIHTKVRSAVNEEKNKLINL